MLQASRTRTLALLDAYATALGPQLTVSQAPQLNLPLWELGHVGWFQEFWIGRNRQRALGALADADAPRAASCLSGADAQYDSSHVPHDARWSLPLPDLMATRKYLAQVLDQTLELLAQTDAAAGLDDAAWYFFRLVLFHEDMHAEAAVYMAQALGIPLDEALVRRPSKLPVRTSQPLHVEACTWHLGWTGGGFAFDNELGAHPVALSAFQIDSQPVRWREFLDFVEDQQRPAPRYLRRDGGRWECQRFGQWQLLDLDATAVHLTYFEAQAWCQWAGRALPTEAQWECAAMNLPGFQWGEVWEWTASPFAPYPGFLAHPYRDYSQPWFDGRPVLRGASSATSPRMAHPRYRNYFTPERNDIHAGFRSCSPP